MRLYRYEGWVVVMAETVGIDVWTDTAKLTNMVIARFGDR